MTNTFTGNHKRRVKFQPEEQEEEDVSDADEDMGYALFESVDIFAAQPKPLATTQSEAQKKADLRNAPEEASWHEPESWGVIKSPTPPHPTREKVIKGAYSTNEEEDDNDDEKDARVPAPRILQDGNSPSENPSEAPSRIPIVDVPSPARQTKAATPPIDKEKLLAEIVDGQSFSGSWPSILPLQEKTGISMDDYTAAISALTAPPHSLDLTTASAALSTVTVITYLRNQLASHEEIWELLVAKAETWLEETLDANTQKAVWRTVIDVAIALQWSPGSRSVFRLGAQGTLQAAQAFDTREKMAGKPEHPTR